MKISIKRIAPLLIIVAAIFTSCLEGDDTNFPTESSGSSILELIYNPSGEGTTINSGLNYFTGAALQFSTDDPNDTTSFVVSIEGGGGALKSDLVLSIKIDEAALLDNYVTDSTDYLLMTDDQYEFINTTATIKAGETSAEFKVIFKPSQFTDPTLSYNLPITVTNNSDIAISSNYGHIYFHVIGNPIAGIYNWDFIRYSNPEATGSPDGQTVYGRTTVLAPVGPTSINVHTGYYNKPNYLITFTNSAGVLSKFKAVIDPDEIKSYFTDNGITVTSGPKITLKDVDGNVITKGTADEIYSYTVNYTTATRNCTDIFYK